MEFLTVQNYEELPEVKLKNKEDENKFAIMVQNENKDGYQEYDGNEFPKDGYEFNETETKCIDNNGSIVEHAISFASETNTVTLETDKTIYCTLYFDKKEPLKITNVAVDTSVDDKVTLNVETKGGSGKYTYSVDFSCTRPCTRCRNSSETYNENIITITNLGFGDCYTFNIKVTDSDGAVDDYVISKICLPQGIHACSV